MPSAVSSSISPRRTNRRSAARRNASVSPVASCNGRRTNVPSGRKPPSVNESGLFQVYAQPIPRPGPRVQVSLDGGSEPIWAKRGSTLYYRGPTHAMAAEIGRSPLRVLRRDSLFADVFSDGGDLQD